MSDLSEEILEELKNHQLGLKFTQPPEPTIQQFFKVWPGLLFTHRFNGIVEDPSEALARSSFTLQRAEKKVSRAEIGTDECVFCSVGAAPYWDPPVVLMFGPIELQANNRFMTPWDTQKAAAGKNHLKLSGAELVRRYSLASTFDRQYLTRFLGICFSGLIEYIDGERPVRVDPAGVFYDLIYKNPPEDLAPLHTVEARFEGDLVIGYESLRAVFVDAEAIRDSQQTTILTLQRLVERAEGAYIPLKRTAGAVDYKKAASQFLQGWLREEGWL